MDRSGLGDEIADSLEVVGTENVGIVEVGEEESVRGRRGRAQRGKIAEVESKVGAPRGG